MIFSSQQQAVGSFEGLKRCCIVAIFVVADVRTAVGSHEGFRQHCLLEKRTHDIRQNGRWFL